MKKQIKKQIGKTKTMNVVGVMSGTSLDGVDFVLTRMGGKTPVYKDMASVSFPKALRQRLFDLAEGGVDFREGQRLHFELGAFYEKSLKKIIQKKQWKMDLIGLHGQTVFHEAPRATSQIGEPSYLKSFGVPVVSDFRSKIISAGGEGAPLAPIFHKEIMRRSKSWGFLNLGGMSNISLFNKSKFVATDLGPANVFLDQAAKHFFNLPFDKDGKKACKGLPELKIVKDYIKNNAFIKHKCPKSCGREEFSEVEFKKLLKKMKSLSPEDALATFAEITLFPIHHFLSNTGIEKLVVSGGGVKNQYLMKRLKMLLPEVEVETSEALGWPSQAVEGGAFAHLAFLKILEKKSDLSYMGLKKTLSPLGRVD